ncbi:MAG: hypothetical protein ABIH76_00485 [Candidatus Bathyarchaeota archaeon]
MVASKVVVDHDLGGWADKNKEELLEQWSEFLEVGKHPDLPQKSNDAALGTYCNKHDCDFLTADKTAYTHYFEAKIEAVRITRYGFDEKGDKEIYLVEIIQTS